MNSQMELREKIQAQMMPSEWPMLAMHYRRDALFIIGPEVQLARLGPITDLYLSARWFRRDIQEQILDLPLVERGHDPVTERDLRPIAAMLSWQAQREAWMKLRQPSQ